MASEGESDAILLGALRIGMVGAYLPTLATPAVAYLLQAVPAGGDTVIGTSPEKAASRPMKAC